MRNWWSQLTNQKPDKSRNDSLLWRPWQKPNFSKILHNPLFEIKMGCNQWAMLYIQYDKLTVMMILFWIKTSVRECLGSSSILFGEWSYDHMKVTADIFFLFFRSLWCEITTVLEFTMLLFFLGHVFGSTIIQCVGACSSSIQFLHTYHCMIHGWWAWSLGHRWSWFGPWCLKIFVLSKNCPKMVAYLHVC